MALLNICGFETGDATDHFGALSGSGGSIQTTTKRTGAYAYQSNPTTTNVANCRIGGLAADGTHGTTHLNVATAYYRFYFRVATLPGSGSEELFRAQTNASALKFALRITSAGKLQAYDSSGTSQLGSDGATTLSADVWYRIEVKVGTGATADYEVLINGASELSGTGNLNTSNNSHCALGKHTNRSSQTVDFYYDDVAISDSAYPGAGAVGVLRPDGDGNYTAFTIGAGAGSKWQQVDEAPTDDDTTYLLSTLTIDQAYTATLASAASAGISGTIAAAKAVAVTKKDGGTASTCRLRLRSSTTDSDTGSNKILIATTYEALGKVYETDPATAAAWTTGGLDGAEVGLVEKETTDKTRLTAVFLMVEYLVLGTTYEESITLAREHGLDLVGAGPWHESLTLARAHALTAGTTGTFAETLSLGIGLGMGFTATPAPALLSDVAQQLLVFYDPDGVRQAVVVDFRAVALVRRVNAPGLLQFSLNGEHFILESLADKWEVEFWRKPPRAGWIREFVGVYRDEAWSYGQNGPAFVGYCPGVLARLGWRIVNWPAGLADRTKFTGQPAETVMKTLVDYNAGANATAANGRKRDGAIAGITVQADGAGGNTVDWYCAQANLLETLQKLAAIAGGDFDLVKTGQGSNAWEFRWYAGQLGQDRTATVKFSMELGNMAEPAYQLVRSKEWTLAAVWGQGEEAGRDYVAREGANFAAGNDIEAYVDARDVDLGDTAGLNARGDQKLVEAEARAGFAFRSLDTPAVRYGVEYNLGDLVTAVNPFTGESLTQKVVAVSIQLDEDGAEQIRPEFATP